MKVDLPSPPPGPMRDYLVRLTQAVHRYLSSAVDETTAIEGIYLKASNGSVYRLTVSNTGTLVTTHVQGGP